MDSQIIADLHPNSGDGTPDTSRYVYPHSPVTFTFARNLSTTIDNLVFSGFNGGSAMWADADNPYDEYNAPENLAGIAKLLVYAGSGDPVLDEDHIRYFMKFMTGSSFVPISRLNGDETVYYAYIVCKDIVSEDKDHEPVGGHVWRLEYINGQGLYAFLVKRDYFPLATLEMIDDIERRAYRHVTVVPSISSLLYEGQYWLTEGESRFKLYESYNDQPVTNKDILNGLCRTLFGGSYDQLMSGIYPLPPMLLCYGDASVYEIVRDFEYDNEAGETRYYLCAYKRQNIGDRIDAIESQIGNINSILGGLL